MHNLSAKIWSQDDENAFDGDHCLLKTGYGALADALSQGLDIRLSTQVPEIDHAVLIVMDYAVSGKDPCKVSVVGGEALT
jgi:hypothetical protein